jgi:hypothetical protein
MHGEMADPRWEPEKYKLKLLYFVVAEITKYEHARVLMLVCQEALEVTERAPSGLSWNH